MAQPAHEPTSCTALAAGGGDGVLAARPREPSGIVASAAASNVPRGAVLHATLARALAVQLLVEREDGALAGLVDVACAAATAAELGLRLGESGVEE